MKVEIVATSLLPRHMATYLATHLRAAVEARGVATLALSGGGGLGPMFEALREQRLPWDHIHVFQVDERIAPDGHEDRNWTDASAQLITRLRQPPAGVHPMPVAGLVDGTDPDGPKEQEAVHAYLDELEAVAGHPIVLDVVHLGLGPDGHTASLIPGDPVLEVDDRDVAVSGSYQGRRRMTMTYPALARARNLVWLVAGSDKADAVGSLVRGEVSIPAARVRQDTATLLIDPDAATSLR
jgi:6-phosphogluconolactonase